MLNHGKTPEKAVIKVKVKENGKYSVEELFQNKKATLSSQNGELTIETSDISVKNGEVWKIQKARK